MKRPGWALFLFGAVAYLGFLIGGAPATLIEKRLPPSVTVGQLSGTVWAGSAHHVVAGPMTLMHLSWHLLPWGVVYGQLRAELNARGADLNGHGLLSLSRTELSLMKGRASLPIAPWLQQFGVPLPFSGQLSGENLSLRLSRVGVEEAGGKVTARKLNLPDVGLIGSYTLHLSSANGTIKGRLKTLDGPLRLHGSVTITNGTHLTLDAVAHADANLAPEVMDSLAMAGRRRPDGSVLLHRRINLTAWLRSRDLR